MDPPHIRPVDRSEADAFLGVLSLAFGTDPCTRFTWPTPGGYLAGYRRLIDAIAASAFDRGGAFAMSDWSAAALWLPPGVESDSDAIETLIAETVAPEQLPVVGQVGEQMQAFHPHEPHWYLSMLGVDPTRQGRGLGSALLKHTLRLCDDQGCQAYLESSNPKNISLYERHGFEVLGQIAPGDFPGLTPMLRRPV